MKTEHTELADETYWEHLKFAWKTGYGLVRMGFIMFVHGLLPEWKRFDGHIMPFFDDLQKQLTVRKLKVAHALLMKRMLDSIAKDIKDSDS